MPIPSAPPMPMPVPSAPPLPPDTPTQRGVEDRGAFRQLIVDVLHEIVSNTLRGNSRVSVGGLGGGDDSSSSDDESKGNDPSRNSGKGSFPMQGQGSGGNGGKGGRGTAGEPAVGGGGSSSSSDSDSDKSMDSNSEIFKGIISVEG
jgi:hypothetical protein